MNEPDSLALHHLYTREYYLHGVAGHEAFRRGAGGLDALVNVRKAYALALAAGVRRATDIGAGRGELAKHLAEQGIEVTLVDYSPAAMEIARRHVGGNGRAAYLTITATELDRHLEPASQDLIFMCDFAEHVSRDELREVFRACARVLAPGGAVVVHSPEKTSGAVLSQRAVEERHINLMDIADLRGLLGEAFGYAEAFTWNARQAHCRPGRDIDLFGVARMEPYAETAPPVSGDFLLRCEVKGHGTVRGLARVDGVEHPFTLEAREGEPCVLLLASRLLGDVHGAERIELEGDAEFGPPVVLTAC